ncbi:DUF2189 domain-containing protein [Thiolinea disciformis]|uniref:DUF2189 domain-containing protein n=1 Tax=Thiolinea disciformis TaxID=125614 RepID=UPI00036DFF1E|nr:DUF2189 domain-containing protein [Thiolinea disciformis]
MSEPYNSKHVIDAKAPSTSLLFGGAPVNVVNPSYVSKWLRQGWQDFKHSPMHSLVYGFIFAIIGIFLERLSDISPSFRLSAVAGFLLLGPFLSLGLYDISRQIEKGQPVSLFESALAIKHNMFALILYALALSAVMFVWIRVSVVVMGIFFNQANLAGLSSFELTMTIAKLAGGPAYLLVFFATGFLFALGAFVSGVVTVPLMLDRKADIVTAVNTSIRACLKNPKTMALWAMTVAVLIGLGIFTYYLGLIVAAPVVAQASWHVYRDLVANA